MRLMSGHLIASAVLSASMSPAALAQGEHYRWFGIWLHPEGAIDSHANAIDGEIPSGKVHAEVQDAAIWPTWSTLYVNLRPSSATSAVVEGADGGRQVGSVFPQGQWNHAALWQGTAESVIDISPPSPYLGGWPHARRGNQIVGYGVSPQGDKHACLWLNDDPNQFVDLHPPEADWSEATATDGSWQGGRAAFPDVGLSAALWKRTSWSFVDMGPGEHRDGWIHGMAPGTQVGEYVNLSKWAVLWHDSPESWIDMSPSWSGAAALFATTGDLHIGWANRPGVHGAHAGIWHGDDPDSFFDLHPFVPPQYADYGSTAYDIDIADGVVYIAGTVNAPLAHAFLWVGVPLDTGDGGGPKSPGGLTKVRKP
jgi:hypothetical protein